MTASIIICTRDRAEALEQTLAAMASLRLPSHIPTELIVVDNGSTDRTASVVQHCRLPGLAVRYLFEERRGQSYARNAGIAAAQGDIILFTDDDVRLPSDWIARMCDPLLAGEADAIAGGVTLAPHIQQDWMQPAHRKYLASTEDMPPGVDMPAMLGANMAFARHVLACVPQFDTELGPGQYGFCDDSLFSLQVRAAGFHIATMLDIAVEHHPDLERITPKSFVRRMVQEGRSQAYLTYHWEHDTCAHDQNTFPGTRVTQVRTTLLRRILALAGLRLARRRERRMTHGLSDWELRKIRQIAFYRQYLIERRRPRNYDHHGLVKKPQNIS